MDHYQLLGLSQSATPEQIRRAFRRLAHQWHPDKNSSPEAADTFRDLNEAYEVLIDPQRRVLYDALLLQASQPGAASTEFVSPQPQHRDPRYRPRAPRPPGYKSRNQRRFEAMVDALPYLRVAVYVVLGFCLLLAIDLALPDVLRTMTISRQYINGRQMRESVIFGDGNFLKLHRSDAGQFRPGEQATAAYSRLCRVPLWLENSRGYRARPPVTIYGNFLAAPLLLLAMALGALWKRHQVEPAFNFSVVSVLLLMLNVLFLFVHHLPPV